MQNTTSLWRRTDGDTILHCTIQREYFELALQIIHLYKDQKIAGVKGKDGDTPLLVLASIPSAFKGGTPMSLWQSLCYSCIREEDLKIDTEVDGQVCLAVGNSTSLEGDDDPRKSRGSIRKMKEKHVWSAQIVEQLLQLTSEYDYSEEERHQEDKQNQQDAQGKLENSNKQPPCILYMKDQLAGKTSAKDKKNDSIVSGNKEWSAGTGKENT
ncbi:uncharacterized protein LOC129291857 isoform X2 [Prosopis cineraria]|uniref:uncharacterized protein LOC129291857 isoform X2 n=1 Tax=Prosopis cineraria TaxID=364024 RepID=UPI0024103FDE|nr:uncharacterized protein LOC129291857 isoform X2 [Prosopis cineraria]